MNKYVTTIIRGEELGRDIWEYWGVVGEIKRVGNDVNKIHMYETVKSVEVPE